MSKQTILIIEDDRWLAEQQARVLGKAGYKTALSPHAIAAISAIDDIHPDAIVLDVLLTGSTGFTLLHELQSYSDTGLIPVILCTNLAASITLNDVKPYGVKRILDKATMTPVDVVAAVRSVFVVQSLRTRAIVLRRTNYGEADRILQLLTPIGKRSVMAKGVRREKSRLAGGIELFAICDVVIGEGKGELGILTSARLVQFYGHIMQDYDRMQFAYTAIKLIGKASEMVDEPEWYEVLSEVLMGLDAHSIPLELIQAWFYLRYAGLLGHELSLYHDVAGEKLSADQTYRYDEAEQGFRQIAVGELGSEHIKLLRLIATRPLKTLAQIGGVESILSDCLLVARQHAAV